MLAICVEKKSKQEVTKIGNSCREEKEAETY